ncbi:MAG: beta-galactosidase, partial [Acutalibacter sp.]
MRYTFQPYEKTPLVRGHLNLGGANPQGGRIDVNNLYLERDGKPWVPIMGEFHFSRGSRPHWYRELCKMKAGGVTVVATYLFWIYHEEEEGRFDFTGDRDIRAFLLECQRAGLEAVIRIGPWAHGECRNGGFPDWLLQKPYPLRDNNPGYLEKARLWYREIYRQVQGLSYQEGGPIVGVQLENELVNNAPHLLALKRLAQEVGFQAPLWTVTGWDNVCGAQIPVDEVLPVFGAYADAPWAGTLEPLPPSHAFTFNRMRNDSAIGADQIAQTGPD